MNDIRIKRRELSILRLMYECGMISLELMDFLFRVKKITNEEFSKRIWEKNQQAEKESHGEERALETTEMEEDKAGEKIADENGTMALQSDRIFLDKAEKDYRLRSANRMREKIKSLLDKEYLLEYRSLIKERFKVITLGKKGYDLIHQSFRNLDILEIENSKRERKVRLRGMDTDNFYRHFRINNINTNEYAHHDYLLRLKIALQLYTGNQVVMQDFLSVDSDLFRNKDRSDLLFHIGDKEYVAIEYEKTLKSPVKYLGSKYESNGRMITVPGFFKARQDPSFLPYGNRLKCVIVICENENMMNRLIRYIDALSTPKMNGPHAGQYFILDKFFFIDKSKFAKMSTMLKEGELLNYRKQRIGDKVDYIRSTFSNLLSASGG